MGKERQDIPRVFGNRGSHTFCFHRFRENALDLCLVRNLLKCLLDLIGIRLHVKTAEHVFKLQTLKELVRLLGIRIAVTRFLHVKRNIRMGIDGCQHFTQLRLLPVFFQVLAGTGRLDLLHMGIGIFDGLIILDDLRRRLLTDTRDARNIVGRVAHESLHVDKFCGGDTVTLLHIRSMIVLYLRLPLLCLGDTDLHMLCGKLERIPVSGDDGHVHALLLAHTGDRPQQVVRLKACLLDDLNIHRS